MGLAYLIGRLVLAVYRGVQQVRGSVLVQARPGNLQTLKLSIVLLDCGGWIL